jgi:hypothetical protein
VVPSQNGEEEKTAASWRGRAALPGWAPAACSLLRTAGGNACRTAALLDVWMSELGWNMLAVWVQPTSEQ